MLKCVRAPHTLIEFLAWQANNWLTWGCLHMWVKRWDQQTLGCSCYAKHISQCVSMRVFICLQRHGNNSTPEHTQKKCTNILDLEFQLIFSIVMAFFPFFLFLSVGLRLHPKDCFCLDFSHSMHNIFHNFPGFFLFFFSLNKFWTREKNFVHFFFFSTKKMLQY